MAELEIKKSRKGLKYSPEAKVVVLNVLKYLRAQSPNKSLTQIVRQTAYATGCSEKAIYTFRKELGIHSLNTHKSATDYSKNTTNPSEINIDRTTHANCKQATDYSETTTSPSQINIDRTTHANWEYANLKCNVYVCQAITDAIHFLQKRDITPTLTNIMEQLKPDSEIPKFSLTVLHWLIYDMGFHYKQNGNKVVLIKDESLDTKDYKEFKVLETQFTDMSYSNLCKQEPAFLKEEPVFVKPELFSSEVDQLYYQEVIHSVSLVYASRGLSLPKKCSVIK